MSTPVLYQEPARTALADALFTSDLSARCEHTRTKIATAIGYAISTHTGTGGCAAEVAAAYGEHPEMAARRMRWARAVIEGAGAAAARAREQLS
jgi:hypothetical protein